MNYFSLFDLPVHYQIDHQMLIDRFKSLQHQYHPDRFVSKSQMEQVIATKKSTDINQAWQILSNPLSRAEYLLDLHGFGLDNKLYTLHDKIFLTEQLLLREELVDIELNQDAERLLIFTKRIKEMFDVYHQQMVIKLNDKEWKSAVEILLKLRFFDTLRSAVIKLEEKLLDI